MANSWGPFKEILSEIVIPPKFNGWNLKMMVVQVRNLRACKGGMFFTSGVFFQNLRFMENVTPKDRVVGPLPTGPN